MASRAHSNGYWTKPRVLKVAQSCKTRKEFYRHKVHGTAPAHAAQRGGYLQECYKYMKPTDRTPPNKKWSREKVLRLVKKCKGKTVYEFSRKHPGAYSAAHKYGWWKECLEYLEPTPHSRHNKKWTRENVLRLVKKNRKLSAMEFCEKHPGAYSAAHKHGWWEECKKHLRNTGSRYERAIYAIEFPDKSVYVGLTYDYLERYGQHTTGSSNKHVRNGMDNHSWFYWMEFGKWLPPEEAAVEEQKVLEDYKNRGYEILNINATGAVGGSNLRWTKERVLEVARKCETMKEFRKKFSGARSAAAKGGYMDEIHKIIPPCRKPKGYWTKERVLAVAKKCKSRHEFHIAEGGSPAQAAAKGGYADECIGHMVDLRRRLR